MKLAIIHFDKAIPLPGLYSTNSMTVNGRSGETMERDGDTVRISHSKLPPPGYVLVPWHRVLQCTPAVVEVSAEPEPTKTRRIDRSKLTATNPNIPQHTE